MTAPKTERLAPTSFPVKVRTTFRPDVELEIDEPEWLQLYAQGQLVEGEDGTTEVRRSELPDDVRPLDTPSRTGTDD